MIRRLWQLTQLAFQGDGGTTRCQRRRHQDVVNTKTEIALERQSPVIPPAIQPSFLTMQTEGIAQPPCEQSCESGTLVRVKQNSPFSLGRIIDIACFRGDIEIAAYEHDILESV